jgi:hypothetical protein
MRQRKEWDSGLELELTRQRRGSISIAYASQRRHRQILYHVLNTSLALSVLDKVFCPSLGGSRSSIMVGYIIGSHRASSETLCRQFIFVQGMSDSFVQQKALGKSLTSNFPHSNLCTLEEYDHHMLFLYSPPFQMQKNEFEALT